MLHLFKRITLFSIIFSLFFIGCDTTETTDATLTLNFANESDLGKVTAEFQLTEVKILMKEIKIKNKSSAKDHNVKTGPYVVQLNLQSRLTEFAVAPITAGSYNSVKFEIHKIEASETPPDPEFKEGEESEFRFSTIVKGEIDGTPFTYRSKKSAKQDIKITDDIVVDENGSANLSITVDPYQWFYEGDKFLDPNDPSNDDKIDNNLKYGFKNAYRDNNKDGQPD
ncbi:MAG: hypothetical protein ABFS12_14025 [Bacteroidota bacterium]